MLFNSGLRAVLVKAAIAIAVAHGDPAIAGIEVPPHRLPVPTTVSEEMQAVIRKAVRPAWPAPLPTTNAGWNEMSNPDPAATRAKTLGLLSRLKLDLEEREIGGVHCYVITPREMAGENERRLLVHIHGGGYVLGAGEKGIAEALLVAGASEIKTISIDYRMPPEHPFPTPVDDAVALWKAVTAEYRGYATGLFGSSAGGAMVLSVVQRSIAENFAVPAAIVAGTPWSDLSETGDSYFTNRYADPLAYRDLLRVMAEQYANGFDLHDPRLSPVYGSFDRFPPTLLLTGTRDLFLSNTVRVDRKIRDAGEESELIVYEGQSHARYASGLDVPETLTWLRDVTSFWKTWLVN